MKNERKARKAIRDYFSAPMNQVAGINIKPHSVDFHISWNSTFSGMGLHELLWEINDLIGGGLLGEIEIYPWVDGDYQDRPRTMKADDYCEYRTIIVFK